jgi:hypothetical protein
MERHMVGYRAIVSHDSRRGVAHMDHDEILDVRARAYSDLMSLGSHDHIGENRRTRPDPHLAVNERARMDKAGIVDNDIMAAQKHESFSY